jgi:hypothetical protein
VTALKAGSAAIVAFSPRATAGLSQTPPTAQHRRAGFDERHGRGPFNTASILRFASPITARIPRWTLPSSLFLIRPGHQDRTRREADIADCGVLSAPRTD